MPKQATRSRFQPRVLDMTAILSIVVGVLIIIWPNILAVAVGLYSVVTGVLRLMKR